MEGGSNKLKAGMLKQKFLRMGERVCTIRGLSQSESSSFRVVVC